MPRQVFAVVEPIDYRSTHCIMDKYLKNKRCSCGCHWFFIRPSIDDRFYLIRCSNCGKEDGVDTTDSEFGGFYK